MDALRVTDSEIASLIAKELARQRAGIELIASENFASPAVLEAMGSVLTNKYSEGYPGKRYYGGNDIIDQVENLAIERAKILFGADYANVQPHSGSQANMAVYFALLKPGDVVLSMDLAHGGHLTHGSKVSFSGQLYTIHSYGVDPKTEWIDYDEVRTIAQKVKPKLIIAGASAYPRIIDFTKFAEIARDVDALLMADIAHIAGLIVAKLHPTSIGYADVTTTTTHKTLRGPRGAIILAKKELGAKLDKTVMPGMQGGPLDHIIAAKAVAFKEAMEPSFATYQKATLDNARVLGETLIQSGLRVVSGGTDNHLLLIDVTPLGIGGKEAEAALERAGIYVNKNMIPFDQRKPLDPSGIRLGTPAITTRGFTTDDMVRLGKTIDAVLRHPTDEQTLHDARRTVAEMTSAHPLYADL